MSAPSIARRGKPEKLNTDLSGYDMADTNAGTEPLNSVGEALSRAPRLEMLEEMLAHHAPAGPAQQAGEPEPEAQAAGEDQPENAETVHSQNETEPPDDPPTESEAEAEAEPKPKPAEAEEDKELPEAVRKRIEKRIGKEVGKRKALESQLAEMRAELDSLKAGETRNAERETRKEPEPEPTAQHDPVNELPEVRKVRAEEEKFTRIADGARSLLKEARRDPDAVVEKLTKSGLQVPADPDDLRDWLEEQRDGALAQSNRLAAQREVITQRAQATVQETMRAQDAEALKVYPWHSDKEDPRHLAAKAIVQAHPWIMKRPDRLKILGRLVEGEQAEQVKLQAGNTRSAGSRPKSPPPKLPGAPAHSPETPSTATASRQAVLLRAGNEPHNKEARVAALQGLLEG